MENIPFVGHRRTRYLDNVRSFVNDHFFAWYIRIYIYIYIRIYISICLYIYYFTWMTRSDRNSSMEYWVGLYKVSPCSSTSATYWIDGNNSTYRNWTSGEPERELLLQPSVGRATEETNPVQPSTAISAKRNRVSYCFTPTILLASTSCMDYIFRATP